MTCIVGLEHQGSVWMGADSLSSNSVLTWTKHRTDAKIFRVGDMLLGFCGSPRVAQAIRYGFKPPAHPKRETTPRYLVNRFVPALRKFLMAAGTANEDKKQESIAGSSSFLLAYRGRLFAVWDNYQVDRYAHGYAATGSGYQLSMGAMHVMRGCDYWHPGNIIRKALAAAAEHDPGVGRPFIVRHMKG